MKKIFVIIAMVVFLSMGATVLAEPSLPGLAFAEKEVQTNGYAYDVTLAGGYIYDDVTGDGIPGADVTVHCVETGKTMTDTTDSFGYYLVTIQCSPDNTVEVYATTGDKSGSDSGTANYLGSILMGESLINISISRVDVTIPEFPVTALPALLSMFSFGLIRKRLF